MMLLLLLLSIFLWIKTKQEWNILEDKQQTYKFVYPWFNSWIFIFLFFFAFQYPATLEIICEKKFYFYLSLFSLLFCSNHAPGHFLEIYSRSHPFLYPVFHFSPPSNSLSLSLSFPTFSPLICHSFNSFLFFSFVSIQRTVHDSFSGYSLHLFSFLFSIILSLSYTQTLK